MKEQKDFLSTKDKQVISTIFLQFQLLDRIVLYFTKNSLSLPHEKNAEVAQSVEH